MKKIMLVCALLPALVCAQPETNDTHIVLRDGATVTCEKPPKWFAGTQFTIENKGAVNIANPQPDRQPQILYARKVSSLVGVQQRLDELDEKLASFAEKTAAVMRAEFPEVDARTLETMHENFSIAFKELRAVVQRVEETKALVEEMLHGDLDVPITDINNEQVAQLSANLRIIKERVDELAATVSVNGKAGAMAAGPVLQVPHNDQVVAELSHFLQGVTNTSAATDGAEPPLLLSQSVVLPAGNALTISNEVSFDGAGQSITFARSPHAQLIVTEKGRLTLSNITLKDIGAKTIMFEPGAQLRFGDGVRCEFLEDVVLRNGSITLVGEDTVVDFIGTSGVRTVSLTPQDGTGTQLQLEGNTLCLHELFLHGTSHIQNRVIAGRESMDVGAVALCGTATLGVDTELRVGVLARGRDNTLLCFGAGRGLYGPIMFAPHGDNHLNLQVVARGDDEPLCTFGKESLFLSSQHGHAHLHLGSHSMMWRLLDVDAVLLGANSVLSSGEVVVLGEPLRQVACSAALSKQATLRRTDGYNAVVYQPHDAPVEPRTAVHGRWQVQCTDEGLGHALHESSDTCATYSGCVQLQRAAGDIVVDGGTVTQFGVDPYAQLSLTLAGNATLRQHEAATTLKHIDVIRVKGNNNHLFINDLFTWDGTLVCEQEAELTITLAARGRLQTQPQNMHAWVLRGASRVTVEGDGQWVVAAPLGIDGSGAGAKEAHLLLSDGVQVTVNDGVTLALSGRLALGLQHGATVHAELGSMITMGAHTDDRIALSIDGGSVIDLGDDIADDAALHAAGKRARLSAGKGAYSLLVQRHGLLRIGRGGVCELNSREEEACPGVCEQVQCQYGGCIELTEEGTLLLSDNRWAEAKAIPFAWYELGCGLYGTGTIGLPQVGLRAHCQQLVARTNGWCVKGNAREVVAPLVNLMKGLHSSIYFANSGSEKMVMTAHGVIVPLEEGERVVRDDAVTGMVYGSGPHGTFEIKPGGQRI